MNEEQEIKEIAKVSPGSSKLVKDLLSTKNEVKFSRYNEEKGKLEAAVYLRQKDKIEFGNAF